MTRHNLVSSGGGGSHLDPILDVACPALEINRTCESESLKRLAFAAVDAEYAAKA